MPASGSSSGCHVPRSHCSTAPAPYWPSGIAPSKSASPADGPRRAQRSACPRDRATALCAPPNSTARRHVPGGSPMQACAMGLRASAPRRSAPGRCLAAGAAPARGDRDRASPDRCGSSVRVSCWWKPCASSDLVNRRQNGFFRRLVASAPVHDQLKRRFWRETPPSRPGGKADAVHSLWRQQRQRKGAMNSSTAGFISGLLPAETASFPSPVPTQSSSDDTCRYREPRSRKRSRHGLSRDKRPARQNPKVCGDAVSSRPPRAWQPRSWR